MFNVSIRIDQGTVAPAIDAAFAVADKSDVGIMNSSPWPTPGNERR